MNTSLADVESEEENDFLDLWSFRIRMKKPFETIAAAEQAPKFVERPRWVEQEATEPQSSSAAPGHSLN